MKSTYNFKPFDKVLVRDYDKSRWYGDLFLRYIEGGKTPYECLTTNYSQCIPFEGNEHLLGTTDAPDFFEEKKETEEINNNYGCEANFFKKGDTVLVRDSKFQKWCIDEFIKYEKGVYPFNCKNSLWRQCITYEGNEHLLDTTDKPEQREQSKNTLFGIELKPGYVLKFKSGDAGVLFPIREKTYPYKQKLAIIYSYGAWVCLENADIKEVASIHGYSHGFDLASGEVLWQRSDVQKLTKAQIAEKLGIGEQDFEIVE